MRVWIARLRAFGQIPLPDALRRSAALGVAAAFVAVAATILLVISPSIPAPTTTPAPAPAMRQADTSGGAATPPPTTTVAARPVTRRDILAAKRAARRFLNGGYLDFSYGRPVKKIAGATNKLRRALAENPPRVPPNMRDRHARILTMQTEGANHDDIPVLVTLIDTGADAPVTSSLTVRTERRDGRWLVTDIAIGG